MGTVIAVSSAPRGLSRALAWNFYVTEETTIKYQLSNPLFVKLGWTVLPVSKIMRKVIEYQTNPAKPHLDWYVSSIVNSKSNPRFPPSPILLLYITFLKRINQRLLRFNEYYSPMIYYGYARTRLKRNLKQTLSVFFFLFLSFIQFRDIRFEIHPRLNTSRIYIYIYRVSIDEETRHPWNSITRNSSLNFMHRRIWFCQLEDYRDGRIDDFSSPLTSDKKRRERVSPRVNSRNESFVSSSIENLDSKNPDSPIIQLEQPVPRLFTIEFDRQVQEIQARKEAVLQRQAHLHELLRRKIGGNILPEREPCH